MHADFETLTATPPELPRELAQAGAVVDKAIGYLVEQGLSPLSVASALLGGSIGLLARSMGDDAILHVLGNAAASVRAGELREHAPWVARQ